MFSINKNGRMNEGKLIYIEEESSFDFTPSLNSDITFLIGYINIGIDSSTMKLLQVWGFSPKLKWDKKKLIVPKLEKGEIILKNEIEPGVTKRLPESFDWGVSYDKTSGWICVGDENVLGENVAIEFATNTIAVIEGDKLRALWLKPNFC